MENIYKVLKNENKVYLSVGMLLFFAFIVNVTLIGVCPYPDCIHQVYKENTSNFYIALYYLALYGLPLWIILNSFLMLFYFIFIKLLSKNSEYNKLLLRFILFIVSGLIIVVVFAFIYIRCYSNGKFDFWMYPKDTGELLLIILINICLIMRKIFTEKNFEKK